MNSSDASAVAERALLEGALPRPVLRIICGPTGAGKTALAHHLARRHGLTIISADSRQIYRDFDIGTAKPSVADREGIAYRGLDVAAPTARWSAARWAADAEQWITECGADRALVVGGTGLYLRALTAPLHDAPVLDPGARAALDAELLGAGPEGEDESRKARPPAGLPPYLASLYDVPLLTREQEAHLFRKFKSLKI